MKDKKIAVVDYGLSNLYSITKALKPFGVDIAVVDSPKGLTSADGIIIPGVGAFAAGMEGLVNRKLVDPLKDLATKNKPMLGICLGAQLMLTTGFEFGEHQGLGLIPGKVKIFPQTVATKEKIPHIGWNSIRKPDVVDWKRTVLEDIKEGSSVYFVHSYILVPDDSENVLALTEYGDLEFCSAIRKGSIYGTQFHPEKSGELGLKIIKNFINLIK